MPATSHHEHHSCAQMLNFLSACHFDYAAGFTIHQDTENLAPCNKGLAKKGSFWHLFTYSFAFGKQ